GVHVDQLQRLILMESLQVIEQVASGLEQLQSSRLVKHLRVITGGNVVVVLVIAKFIEAVRIHSRARLGRAPKHCVTQCPNENVWGFVGLRSADDKLQKGWIASGKMRRCECDQRKRLGLSVVVHPMKKQRANRTAERSAVLDGPLLVYAQAREVTLANFGREP